MASPYDALLVAAGQDSSASPYDALLEAAGTKPKGSGGPIQGLKDLAAFAGRQIDRVSAGPLRGAEQGIQDYQPTEDGGFHPGGVIAAALQGAGRGFMHPDQVQSGQQMFARMGLSNDETPRQQMTPGFVMKSHAQAGEYGLKPEDAAKFEDGKMYPLTVSNGSSAQAAGMLQDMLAPAPPVGLALRGGAKLAGKAGTLAEKTAVNAAERSILEKYSMAQAKELAPAMGSGKEIQTVEEAQKAIPNATKIVADKLREHDLLYNPGKANFNLNRDLNKYGQDIGATVKEMAGRDVSVDLQDVFDKYTADRINATKTTGKGIGTLDDFQTKVVPKIQSMIDALKDGSGKVGVDKAVAFRQELQDMVKNWGQGEGGGPLIQQVAKEMQYRANQAIAGADKSGPKLAAMNEKYSDLKNLQPLIEDAYSRGFGRAAVGRDVRPLPYTREGIVNRLWETAGSPVKSLMNAKPQWADALANRINTPQGLNIPQAASTLTDADIQALKQPFIPPQGEGLPPRVPNQRRPLLSQDPTYVQRQPSVLDESLPSRQSSYAYPARRPLSPIAPDPSLDVSELGKVLDADAAKEIASTQYQSDRLKVLWKKVQQAQTPKQKSALMNLIRAVHNSTKGK